MNTALPSVMRFVYLGHCLISTMSGRSIINDIGVEKKLLFFYYLYSSAFEGVFYNVFDLKVLLCRCAIQFQGENPILCKKFISRDAYVYGLDGLLSILLECEQIFQGDYKEFLDLQQVKHSFTYIQRLIYQILMLRIL